MSFKFSFFFFFYDVMFTYEIRYEAALLVFSVLAYLLAINQMCCLRVGFIMSNFQFQCIFFRIMRDVYGYRKIRG